MIGNDIPLIKLAHGEELSLFRYATFYASPYDLESITVMPTPRWQLGPDLLQR